MKKIQSQQQGFTLIELIVVIVILGIMSAVAIPQFVNLQVDARNSVMSGVEGTVRSAATLVYSKSLINGTEGAAAGTVTLPSGNVTTAFGYPTANAAGIKAAVDLTGAADVDKPVSDDGLFQFGLAADFPTCVVQYAAPAAVGNAPTITPAAGC